MGDVLRQIRLAATALSLWLVAGACGGSTAVSQRPVTPAPPSSPSTIPSAPSSTSPGDTARQVVDAALASMAEGTFRYDVDVRSADPHDPRAPVTGRGQVSFREPVRFRFASAAGPEVIYDADRFLIRGQRGGPLPEDAWLLIDLGPDVAQAVRDAVIRDYGNVALVLVPPLGAVGARATGQDDIRGVSARRFVADVDISLAREHVPDAVRLALDAQLTAFDARGTSLGHEIEVWVDPAGRVVRTRYRQDASPTQSILVTYELSDFGAPMDVALPDGAEVLTVEEARERYGTVSESPAP